MFIDFNFNDPAKANYYYIYLMMSSVALIILYAIILTIKSFKNKRKIRKFSESFDLGKIDNPEYLENYKIMYGEENLDTEKVIEIKRKMRSLKYRYLIAYLCTRASIWAKAPYMYLLFNRYHGLNISEIGILYIIDAVSALIFGPITGDMADKYGRKLFCILYCLGGVTSQFMRITGIIPLAYASQIVTGFCAGLIATTFESWINYEAEKDLNNAKKIFLEKLFKTQTILDTVLSLIITAIGAVLYTRYGLLYPIYFCMCLSTLAIISMLILWDENKPNSQKA